MKAFELAAREMWVIRPESLQVILDIAARENPDPEAVAAKLGRPLTNTQTVTVRDGVAIIPVSGPLFRYANLFTDISGATSFEMLAKEFGAALDNPEVEAILLDIDSPGGQVNGVADFASHIYAARKIKPVTAYVSGSGMSGAYWIASAAAQVVANPTALLGSIGVIVTAPGTKPSDDLNFISSVSPKKRPDMKSATGLAQIQAEIDALGEVFVQTVAKYRGVSVETVLSEFGEGGVFVGDKAVTAGLADRLGLFEDVLAGLAGQDQVTVSGGRNFSARKESAMSDKKAQGPAENPEITAASVKKDFPDLVADLRKEGYEEGLKAGAQAEQKRILGIEALAMPGHEELIANLKADGETTPEAAALQIMKAEKKARDEGTSKAAAADHLKAVKADEESLPDVDATAKKEKAEEEPQDFMALVRKKAKDEECSVADAIKALYKEKPELHKAYLDKVNAKGRGE